MSKLKIGIPKGSLQEATIALFKKAGYIISVSGRSYFPSINDVELEGMLLRPQEMAFYVEKGVIDAGLAGKDWVRECQADIIEVAELVYSKQTSQPTRWVIAVPQDSEINSVKELEGKTIFTELVETTKRYLSERGVKANVKFSHGATELKIPYLGEAIVDLTETGSSLKAHNLRIVETIMESATLLIANKESWQNLWKRRKAENVLTLLQGALAAENKVGLKMNVYKGNLEKVLAILPAMKRPTISHLSEPDWFALETIIDEDIVRDLIPDLKRVGAEGIVEYPLNKVIP